VESVEVRDRSARHKPFMLVLAVMTVTSALLSWGEPMFGLGRGSAPLAWIPLVTAINTSIAFVTNMFWKISVHMLGVSTALSCLVRCCRCFPQLVLT
jgi:hypothetical protein